ncbi:unnamed protein product [marine sediment metagenome]|uniref:Xylose isomerase-like TIM barrel domain-containing protein n=1 Tax=marine sediment metagenome TaxID=412755 RepID=X0UAH3_9ZZZZ
MAENYNITLTIEPHGYYTTNAEGLLKIMNLSDSDRLAINFDTGNVTIAGNDPVETLKAIINHVVYVHLKDVTRGMAAEGEEFGVVAGVAIGEGEVDIKGCIDVLKGHGYEGYLSIECSGVDQLKRSIEYMRKLL